MLPLNRKAYWPFCFAQYLQASTSQLCSILQLYPQRFYFLERSV